MYQMYAESNVTSCIRHKLGICILTNPSVEKVDYITHAWIGQCANSKLVTDIGSHVTLPTSDTLFSIIYSW